MASLSTTELAKRNNIDIFKKKIEQRKPFTIDCGGGKSVRLHRKYSKFSLKDFESLKDKRGSIFLKTTNKSDKVGNSPSGKVRLNQLCKTSEFAGRTQKTTASEDKEIASLNRQLIEIMDSTGFDFVKVKVGKNNYKVTSVIKTKGFKKSDFSFVDTKGKEVGFISHKDGTTPKGFQQWSGTSVKYAKKIYDHPETGEFITTLKGMFPDGMPNATTVGRKINSENLKKMAVYGHDVKKGTTGVNNVFLGYQAGHAGTPSGSITTGSNNVVLGDNSTTNLYCADTSISSSDARDKTDVADFTKGLDWIKALRPVTYRWDRRTWYGTDEEPYGTPDGSKKRARLHVGFLAQEALEVEKANGYGTSNDDSLILNLTEDGMSYGMKYERLVPVLVNAIKELSARLDAAGL